MAHDVRWFAGCGIGDGEKQKKILEYFINTVLKVKQMMLIKIKTDIR